MLFLFLFTNIFVCILVDASTIPVFLYRCLYRALVICTFSLPPFCLLLSSWLCYWYFPFSLCFQVFFQSEDAWLVIPFHSSVFVSVTFLALLFLLTSVPLPGRGQDHVFNPLEGDVSYLHPVGRGHHKPDAERRAQDAGGRKQSRFTRITETVNFVERSGVAKYVLRGQLYAIIPSEARHQAGSTIAAAVRWETRSPIPTATVLLRRSLRIL